MHNCTCACGNTASMACGNPFSPSTQTINMSLTPRFFNSVSTDSQNLAPSLALVHSPSTSLCPSRLSTRPSCRIFTYSASRYTIPQMGSSARFCHVRTSSLTASVTWEISPALTSAVDFLQVPLDFARGHAARVQRHDLVVEAREPRLMFGQDLGLGEVDEFLGHAFFIEDALDHGAVTAGTLDRVDDGLVFVVHEIVDIAEDGVVDGERELGDGGGDLLADLVFELGVDREGHIEDVLEGRFFELAVVNRGGGAHAGEVEAMDGVGHFFELVVELLAVGGILVEGVEEQVACGIEFEARGGVVVEIGR